MAGKRPHHISLPHLVHQRQCKVDKISFYEGIYFIFSILKGPAVSGESEYSVKKKFNIPWLVKKL